MSSHANIIIGMLAGGAVVWWVSAPLVVSLGDARLKNRNPTHHKRLVRFYRTFGLLAILIGIAVSMVAR